MNVVCKFRCNEVAQQEQGQRVTLPSGELKFFVTNPAVFDAFKPGKEYLITLEEAPAPPAS